MGVTVICSRPVGTAFGYLYVSVDYDLNGNTPDELDYVDVDVNVP